MFKSVNVFQMVVLVLILVGVVMIFMRQNNTCVMKNDDVIEEAHFPGKKMLNTMKAKAAERAAAKEAAWIAEGCLHEHNNTKLGWPIIEYVDNEEDAKIQCADNSQCAGIVTSHDGRYYLKRSGTTRKRANASDLVQTQGHKTWLKTC